MRLIDADAFKEYICNALEQTRQCYPDGGRWAEAITEQFCLDIDEQPTVTSEPHWIPVTERLPESKEEDLEYPTVIIDLDGQVALGCYYESTKEWGMGEYFNQKCFPIAWMPLPEPYKKEVTE